VHQSYFYGLGLVGEEVDGKYTSYHFDYRGSTVALTNETGNVVERFQYSPYGLLLNGDFSVTPFLFNGMYGVMTDENGLYYMRARFYSPEIKRFVNQDVLLGNVAKGQTLNRFAFVTGNPINFIDPFGLDALENLDFIQDGVMYGSADPINRIIVTFNRYATNGMLRKQCVINGGGCLFSIQDNPLANNDSPWYELPMMSQVDDYGTNIDIASFLTGVDNRLIRAIMYVETTHGYYDAPLAKLGLNKSILPMNINISYWGNTFGTRKQLEIPIYNVCAGAFMIRSLQNNLSPEVPISHIATLYNNLYATYVSDYGALVARIYALQPWDY